MARLFSVNVFDLESRGSSHPSIALDFLVGIGSLDGWIVVAMVILVTSARFFMSVAVVVILIGMSALAMVVCSVIVPSAVPPVMLVVTVSVAAVSVLAMAMLSTLSFVVALLSVSCELLFEFV